MIYLELFENFENTEVNDKVQAIIDTINSNEGFEVVQFKALNDTLAVKVKTPRTERPDYSFMDNVYKIPYVREIYSKSFYMGKMIDNCTFVEFRLLLKHGVTALDTSTGFGKIIGFLQKYNVKCVEELVEIIARSANDLNKWIKIGDKTREEKVKLYALKSHAVRFLVHNGGIRDVLLHKGEYEDLVLFYTTVDNISFHMKANKFQEKYGVNTDTLDKEDGVFKSKTYTESDIQDMNRMLDVMKILAMINQNRVQIYNYFNEKIFNLHNYFYNPNQANVDDELYL